jgi:GT2 family glycosyltransferase
MSWAGPDAAPAVSIVIVSYNSRDDLLRCVGSIVAHVSLPFEVLIVDNASRDGSAEALAAAHPRAHVLRNAANAGFAAANNQALSQVRAPLVLLLNPDAEVLAGSVETLVRALERRRDVAAVGPRTLNEDGSVQVSFGPALRPLGELGQRRLVRGVRARRPWALAEAERRAGVEHEPFWISGACMLARLEALRAVGGFDESFFLYEEDADLCLRLRRAGWCILYTPAATVVHRLGKSAAGEADLADAAYHQSHLTYYRKHNGPLLTLALRLYLAGAALIGIAAAVAGGSGAGARRHLQRLRIALGRARVR